MNALSGTNVTIIGASRGIGRALAAHFHGRNAQVMAVARGQDGLNGLARDLPGIATLALDATSPGAADQVLTQQTPHLLILCGGAPAPCVPFQDLTWDAFSTGWNTDTRISFNFLQAALNYPLPDGATIVTLTSGAMLNGSPISGGYAGAKKMQMFLSGYAQKEAARAGRDLRFITLAPLRLIPETGVGSTGIAGYARYNHTTEAEFLAAAGPAMTTTTVIESLVRMLAEATPGQNFGVSPDGLSVLS